MLADGKIVLRKQTKGKPLMIDGTLPDSFIARLSADVYGDRNPSWPRISIVIPSYNCRQFIEQAILSVLNQGYTNTELIVIDGGSKDGTVEIVRKYEKYLGAFVSEKDGGQTAALNKGYARATGDVFGWLNADEEYLPGTLARVGSAFKRRPNLDIFFGNRIKIDENRKILSEDIVPEMYPKNYMLYSYRLLYSDVTFWSRNVHHLTGKLDDVNYPHLAMDYDWFLRLSLNVREWQHTREFVSVFKEHGTRKTTNATDSQTSGKNARNAVIKRLKISKLQLFFYWLYYAVQRRYKCCGMRGLLWRPRISTVLQILGYKD